MPLTRGEAGIALCMPFLFLATLVLAARIYTRVVSLRKPGWEDLFVVLSWVFAVMINVFLCYDVTYFGLGKHIQDLPADQALRITSLLQIVWVSVLLYIFSMLFAKLSMLAQYVRLFPFGSTRVASYIGIGVTVANLIWNLLVNIFFCMPVYKYWDPKTPGKCLPQGTTYFAFAGANIVTSCMIILIPIPAIVKMKLATGPKIAIICLFGIGIFDIIIALLRLRWIVSFSKSKDLTYGLHNVAVYSALECSVAVICASAAALRSLIVGVFDYVSGSLSSSSKRGVHQHGSDPSTKPMRAFRGLVDSTDNDVHSSQNDGKRSFWAPTMDCHCSSGGTTCVVDEWTGKGGFDIVTSAAQQRKTVVETRALQEAKEGDISAVIRPARARCCKESICVTSDVVVSWDAASRH